jgi:hypothetical protein
MKAAGYWIKASEKMPPSPPENGNWLFIKENGKKKAIVYIIDYAK